jgi:enoyl-CoA hydratase/carnithine racemase
MSLLLIERDGPVLTVTLNQPERRNPISDPAMVDALCAAFDAADRDISIHIAILTGAGSAFSSGGDLNAMRPDAGGLRSSLPAQTRRNYREGIQRLPLLFQAMELPVIAAINGPAIGAGLDLSLACDVRIAAQSARFAESFVKLGIVSGDGGAWLLPRIVGFSKATQLSLTGETIDAQEALRIGLVGDVVPDAELMSAARRMADAIAANPPHATRMTKRLMRAAQTADLAQTLDMAGAMQALAHATADHDEALDAFFDRRPPNFKGD